MVQLTESNGRKNKKILKNCFLYFFDLFSTHFYIRFLDIFKPVIHEFICEFID